MPLTVFDTFIKTNRIIYPLYSKLHNYYLAHLHEASNKSIKIFYVSLNIIPRILLVSLLSFDVFYVHKLEFLYNFILIGVFPLFRRYIIYSLKFVVAHAIKKLNNKYNKIQMIEESSTMPVYDADGDQTDWEYKKDMIYHDKFVSLEEYVKIQTELAMYNISPYTYVGDVYITQKVYYEYSFQKYRNFFVGLSSQDFSLLEKDYEDTMSKILRLSIFLERYKIITSSRSFNYTMATIYGAYFVCWGYVLYQSYPLVKSFLLTKIIIIAILVYFKDTIEPFSGNTLETLKEVLDE